MELEVPINSGRHKTDIVFFNAFMKLRQYFLNNVKMSVLKVIAFSVLLPVNLISLNVPYNYLIICIIGNLVSSFYALLMQTITVLCIFQNVNIFLSIAAQTMHTVINQIVSNSDHIQECVSQSIFVVDPVQRTEAELDIQTKIVYQNMTRSGIELSLRNRYFWYRYGLQLSSLISFTSMVYSIVILSNQEMAPIDKCIIIMYVIIVGIKEFKLILMFAMICLSPLICVALLVYCCCCSSNKPDEPLVNIPDKKATATDILNVGGECAICYMNIDINVRIYVLSCSKNHVFHCECLDQWRKVKNSCPICRQQITAANTETSEINEEVPQTVQLQNQNASL